MCIKLWRDFHPLCDQTHVHKQSIATVCLLAAATAALEFKFIEMIFATLHPQKNSFHCSLLLAANNEKAEKGRLRSNWLTFHLKRVPKAEREESAKI